MKNCNCNQNCGGGVVPTPNPYPGSCNCKPARITLKTKTIPANLGGPDGAYAPKPGAEYDTVVIYLATNDIYLYDSNGVFTQIFYGKVLEMSDELAGLTNDVDELFDPVVPAQTVATHADLAGVDPATVPSGSYVEVSSDETHSGLAMLYYYDTLTATWQPFTPASPYYKKAVIDALMTQVSGLAQELEDYKNSPDVRYIVATHADLEAIDKTTIGDQDYARVLQDETHDNASTYYQFNKAQNEWVYVGQTGPYYTKEEIDNMVGEAITRLEAI